MNFRNLNLSIPPLIDSIDPFLLPKVRHTRLNLDVINPEIIELFSKLSLNIVLAEVFYSNPYLFSEIHSDSTGGDINKINWIYGGDNCSMNWYSIKTANNKKDFVKTPIDTRYTVYHLDEVNTIQSTVIKSPSLVNVGIPHNVKNENRHRWCISFVYKFKNSSRRPTMSESLNLFKDYIV
jgi:hypothetical protein